MTATHPPPCPRCQTPLVRATVETQPPGAFWLCTQCYYRQPIDPRAAHRGRREARPR